MRGGRTPVRVFRRRRAWGLRVMRRCPWSGFVLVRVVVVLGFVSDPAVPSPPALRKEHFQGGELRRCWLSPGSGPDPAVADFLWRLARDTSRGTSCGGAVPFPLGVASDPSVASTPALRKEHFWGDELRRCWRPPVRLVRPSRASRWTLPDAADRDRPGAPPRGEEAWAGRPRRSPLSSCAD